MPCCCTDHADGHRCPDAWRAIVLARSARLAGDLDALQTARQAYTAHLRAAGLITYGTTCYPDLCRIPMAEDPRCPQCAVAWESAMQEEPLLTLDLDPTVSQEDEETALSPGEPRANRP